MTQTSEPLKAPLILTISVDQETGALGMATNAASEYGYALLKRAMHQVEETVSRNIINLAERRIRAEVAANGDVGNG